MSSKTHSGGDAFTGYQKFVIGVLAFLQFTIILDFMIMAPLGAMLMPALNITPSQFGWVVSVYAFSAGASGLLAAGFADRFDRKTLLLFFYCGFVLGTLLCGVAPTFWFLLMARMVTGIFGGVIGSIVFAITADLFPFHMRGRVMGFVQTAFAASQILGLPAGLYLSNLWGWHAPFLMIVAVSALVGGVIWMYLKPINEHLLHRKDLSAIHHLKTTINNPHYLFAFGATALLSIGGFLMMPFGSAFTVHNLGINVTKLPLLYLITGLAAIVTGPMVGRLCDRFGKFPIFILGSAISIGTVLVYTHLGTSPFWLVVLVNVILFVGIFSRMIPAQALMSAIPAPSSRGSFMSISSSLQQIAGGFASILAGLIVVQTSEGFLEHFDTLGYVMVSTTLISLAMMYGINKSVTSGKAEGA
jgi:predicted MFS family arabinose efflux permease